MTKKRRNNGRALSNRGHEMNVNCSNCFRLVPKDKAISRFLIRPIVETAAQKDLQDVCAYDKNTYQIPKMYLKVYYCVSCAIHGRIVRVRSKLDRKIRDPPTKKKPQQQQKKGGEKQNEKTQ